MGVTLACHLRFLGFLLFREDNLLPLAFLLEAFADAFFVFFFGVGKSGTKVTAFFFFVDISGEEVYGLGPWYPTS